MTLMESIAALVESGTINKELLLQVLERLAEIQENAVSYEFWVDQIGGDNTNDGLTSSTALQTINAAIGKTPPGSYVLAKILSDYEMEADIISGGRVVRGIGRNASDVATQRRFIQTVAGGAARRLICQHGGAFQLGKLDIYLTKSTISSGPLALCTGQLKTLYLLDCGVDVEAGVTTASLMGPDGISILEVDTVTALDDAIAGSWVRGVSAGADPATLGKVLTNLATL